MTSHVLSHVTDDVTPMPSRADDVAERKTSPPESAAAAAAADTEPVVSAMLVTSSRVCGACVDVVDMSTTQLPVSVASSLSRQHTVFDGVTFAACVSPSVSLPTFSSSDVGFDVA